jgi:hypothetical protein
MILIYILVENNIPIYLGKTNEPNRRLREHRVNFSKDVALEVIDKVEENEWVFWEQWWIELFNSWNITLLNKNKGGGGPNQQTKYSKTLIGNKQRGTKKPTVSSKLKGQKITWDLGTSTAVLQFDKQGNFISEYKSMGEAYSKTKISTGNICEVCKGNRHSAGGYIWLYRDKWDGNPPTLKQHRSKGREGVTKGKNWIRKTNSKRSDLIKPILQFDKNNISINEFSSIREAAKYLNVSEAAISHCCRNKQKTAFGYVWKYKEK